MCVNPYQGEQTVIILQEMGDKRVWRGDKRGVVCVCARALRIVCMGKVMRFISTSIIMVMYLIFMPRVMRGSG